MGQQASQADESRASVSIPSQSNKLKFAYTRKSVQKTEKLPWFISVCCSLTPKRKKQMWREKAIKNLLSVKMENWPNFLAEFLENTNSEKNDRIFFADMLFSIYHDTEPIAVSPGKRLHKSAEDASLDYTNQNNTLSIIQMEPVFPLTALERRASDDFKRTILDESQISGESKSIKNKNLPNQTFDSRLGKEIFLSPLLIHPNQKSIDYENSKESPVKPLLRLIEIDPKTNVTENPGFSELINQPYSPILYAKGDQSARINFSQEGMEKFKRITNLLQNHLTNEKNILCKLIGKFTEYLRNEFQEVPDKYLKGELSEKELNNKCERASKDVELFVEKLYEIMVLFYQLERLSTQKDKDYDYFFSRDNVISFLLSIIFNQNIYEIIYKLYKTKNQGKEKLYQDAHLYLKKEEPQAFGVAENICLNQKTFEYLTEKRLIQTNRQVEFNNTIISEDFLENSPSKTFKSNAFADFTVEEFEGRISEMRIFNPFEKVIEKLQYLSKRRNPIQKFEILTNAIDQIMPAIRDFYRELKINFEDSLKIDDILPITLYLIAKSGLPEIRVHLDFVKTFVPKNRLEMRRDEMFTIIESSLNCICNTKLQDGYNFNNLSPDFQNFFLTSIPKIAALKQQPNTFDNIY